jgi:hypothetical protein
VDITTIVKKFHKPFGTILSIPGNILEVQTDAGMHEVGPQVLLQASTQYLQSHQMQRYFFLL